MKNDIEMFIKSVKSICPELTDLELEQFSKNISVVSFPKKDLFIQAGQIQKEVGFISKGLIRSFYIDKHGNEITVRFYAENDYATHYTAFITQQPSKYSFQCLEPSTLVLLSYEKMQWAYKTFPKFEKYGRLITEEILKMQQDRIESFIFQTAEERYLDFIKQNPDLYNRISLSHTFLGVN